MWNNYRFSFLCSRIWFQQPSCSVVFQQNWNEALKLLPDVFLTHVFVAGLTYRIAVAPYLYVQMSHRKPGAIWFTSCYIFAEWSQMLIKWYNKLNLNLTVKKNLIFEGRFHYCMHLKQFKTHSNFAIHNIFNTNIAKIYILY